jgi:anti-anti-sigma factor
VEISTKTLGDKQVLLEVKGAVDAATAQTLSESINDHFGKGLHHIVIDVSKMNFISSAGIRALLIAHQEAEQFGGEIKVLRPNDHVRRIFEISGINLLIEILDDFGEETV